MTIDIVCQVVDNYGDIAVVWRLAQALVQEGAGEVKVRLLVDDWSSFHALHPTLELDAQRQVLACPGGEVTALRQSSLAEIEDRFTLAEVLVEAFGAPTPAPWLEAFFVAGARADGRPRTILHLEYLTAEAWSEDYHQLPSILGRPGIEKFFFVPGFRAGAGGLVFTDPAPVLPDLSQWRGDEDWLMTLFAYEHDFTRFWEDLVDFLQATGQSARVLVFAGRSQPGALASWQRVSQARGGLPAITVVPQPFVDQDTYTALLAAGDFHVVRGEESWVQAVLSGKPFLWQAYLQPEGHQSVKVEAFLEVWRPRFEREGADALEVFDAVAREFRAINHRFVNNDQEPGHEGYRVFWENRDLLAKVGRLWAQELRKNANLSRKMLEFLAESRI